MTNVSQHDVSFPGDALIILVIGIALLLLVILTVYREHRVRLNNLRERNTTLMLGPYDMYNPIDRLKVNQLADDLYEMYVLSHDECGITLEQTPETYLKFVEDFAHPYIMGKISISDMPDNIATVFRRRHYEYVSNNKPA